MQRSPYDWIASLLIPGWTQLMYFAYWTAGFFFLWTIAMWIWWSWQWAFFIHLMAGLHAASLVGMHFSGRRPATPEAAARRLGTVWPPQKPVSDMQFHAR